MANKPLKTIQFPGLSDTYTIPTKVTDLSNDANYATTSAVSSAIASAIGGINSFDVAVVTALPTQNIKDHTIYFVAKESEINDVYDEFMYIDNSWEKIGNTAVDLSGYATESYVDAAAASVSAAIPNVYSWALASSKPTYTYTEVGAASVSHTHTAADVGALPSTTTYVSSFNGASGSVTFSIPTTTYTSDARIVLEASSTSLVASSYLRTLFTTGKQVLEVGYNGSISGKQGSIYLGNSINNAGYPQGATVINTSATQSIELNLPSSSGNIALVTDIPTVPSWALESTKPTYTYVEVGAMSAATVIPAAQVNADWNASTGVASILNKPSIPDPLPAVTSSDNDKVLTVVNGAWAAQSAGSGLPAITSSDNGKVLTVISGEWIAQDPLEYTGIVNTMPVYDGGVS